MFLFLVACASSSAPTTPLPKRTDSVAAAPVKAVKTDEFCEVRPNKAFVWPEMDAPPPAAAAGWRWVNVWATWCKPCVAEMLMLSKWQERLGSQGVSVDLQFLSVDADTAALASYVSAHAEAKGSGHLKDMKLLPDWLAAVGLDASAVLPVHLFIDPTNTIQCERMGSLGEEDYDVVKRVLQGQ